MFFFEAARPMVPLKGKSTNATNNVKFFISLDIFYFCEFLKVQQYT